LPSTINCTHFFEDFASSLLTIPGHFAAYGYNTTVFGKMHFQDVDQMHGWLERPMGDIHTAIRPPLAPGVEMPGLSKSERAEYGIGFWGPAKEIRNARVINEEESWDYLVTQAACHYLRRYFADSGYDRPRGDQPLLFCLSTINPHYPFQCGAERFEYYLNRVKPFYESVPDSHPAYQQYSVDIESREAFRREIQRATAAYYGQVEFMDAMFGKVIDQLEQLNVLDDFVILYFSDHGDMLGQHGCWEKKQFYEGSIRVPLTIYSPRHKHAVNNSEAVVSLLDLFPTLCDIANLPQPDDLQGGSLLPLLEGRDADWKDEAVAELWGWYHGGKGCFMIRRGKYKYIWYGDDRYPDQLFDLEHDPDEKDDLSGRQQFAELQKVFKKEVKEIYGKLPREKQDLTKK
jgi:choline-sulfatase